MKRSRIVMFLGAGVLFIFGAGTALVFPYIGINKTTNDLALREHHELKRKLNLLGETVGIMQQDLFEKSAGGKKILESGFVTDLLERINKLEQKIASLETGEKSNMASSSLSSRFNPDSKESSLSPSNPTIMEASIKQETAHYQSLEDNFQGEEQDPKWALAVTSKLEESLDEFRNQTSSTAALLSMDCKTTLCRVEIEFADSQQATFMELALLQNMGDEVGESSSRQTTDASGRVSTIYYLARNGHSVASMSKQPAPQ